MQCSRFLTPSSEIVYRGEIRFVICNDMGKFVGMHIILRDNIVKDRDSVLRELRAKQWFKGKIVKEFAKYIDDLN